MSRILDWEKFNENADSPPETRLNIFKSFHKDSSQGAMDDNIKKSAKEILRIEADEAASEPIADLVTAAKLDGDIIRKPLPELPEEDNRLVINKPERNVRRVTRFPYGMSGKGVEVLPK